MGAEAPEGEQAEVKIAAWLLMILLSDYGGSGFPVVIQMQGPRLPPDADCMVIRQIISQDLNLLEGGVAVYVECQQLWNEDAY